MNSDNPNSSDDDITKVRGEPPARVAPAPPNKADLVRRHRVPEAPGIDPITRQG